MLLPRDQPVCCQQSCREASLGQSPGELGHHPRPSPLALTSGDPPATLGEPGGPCYTLQWAGWVPPSGPLADLYPVHGDDILLFHSTTSLTPWDRQGPACQLWRGTWEQKHMSGQPGLRLNTGSAMGGRSSNRLLNLCRHWPPHATCGSKSTTPRAARTGCHSTWHRGKVVLTDTLVIIL